MPSGIKRLGSRGVFARRAAQLGVELVRATRQVEQEAAEKARQGLTLNVYGTIPGHYSRTWALFISLRSSSQSSGGQATITLEDGAPYASFIEFGTGPSAISQQQLDQYLASLPPGRLMTFGRSGQAYMLPGPYIGPAVWYARARMQAELRAVLVRLWR